MKSKGVSGIMLTPLLVVMVTFVFAIQPAISESTTITVPDDYPSIQEAINNASEGDIIFVKQGIYYENVVVNKTISLIGESRNTTVIDGKTEGIVVYMNASNVVLNNFTVKNSGGAGGSLPGAGILLFHSNDTTISENLIVDNSGAGVYLIASSNCTISHNLIVHNGFSSAYQVAGIYLHESCGSKICENYLESNGYGIYLHESNRNDIKENQGMNNGHSIYLTYSINNHVENNSALNNYRGIYLWNSSYNQFFKNFVANTTWENLFIYNSQGCLIINNTFSNGYYGICISDELPYPPQFDGNTIYYNTLENNKIQASVSESINCWDNGAEGNHWSDYQGKDEDGDGIGDVPYFINESNQDNCPLMPYYVHQETQVSRTLFDNLLRRYNELITNYYRLYYNIYKGLNRTYNNLNSSYDNLNASYNELKQKQEETTSELNNIRNLMYLFVTTTAVSIASAVYFAKTKSKKKSSI